MRREALPPGHPIIATSLHNLADLCQSKGEYDRALPLYEEALEMKRAALPSGHPDIARSLNNLAGLYHAKGEYDRALAAALQRGAGGRCTRRRCHRATPIQLHASTT
jgi:tetratricopeptide (TPR) repeat protein